MNRRRSYQPGYAWWLFMRMGRWWTKHPPKPSGTTVVPGRGELEVLPIKTVWFSRSRIGIWLPHSRIRYLASFEDEEGEDRVVFRLRSDEAPDLIPETYTAAWDEASDIEIGQGLDLEEGLPGLYFSWKVAEIIEGRKDETETLVCALHYSEAWHR